VGGGPGQVAAAVAGGLVELLAEPVPLGPQLTSGQPLEIGAAGGVDGQGLPAGPGQGLGQLQIGIRLLSVGQIQLPSTLRFWADDRVQPVSWRARDSCTYNQLTSSLPVSRTRARPRVNPWARCPVVA
jgi:hypothetical protein